MIKCFSYPQRYSPNIFAAALIPLFTGLVSYGSSISYSISRGHLLQDKPSWNRTKKIDYYYFPLISITESFLTDWRVQSEGSYVRSNFSARENSSGAVWIERNLSHKCKFSAPILFLLFYSDCKRWWRDCYWDGTPQKELQLNLSHLMCGGRIVNHFALGCQCYP